MKARSELIPAANFSEGFVSDNTLRFQIASAASYAPPRSPTRGSGVGGERDSSPCGTEVCAWNVEGANAVAKTITANAVANDGTVEGDRRRVGILKLIWSNSSERGW